MTSEPTEAFVWTWLPGADEPVVAGRIELTGGTVRFNYGRSYLARPQAIPLYLPELPLRAGPIEPLGGLTVPGCIKDGGPDAWGQRVIMQHLLGAAARGGNRPRSGRSPTSCTPAQTASARSTSRRAPMSTSAVTRPPHSSRI